MVWVFANGPGDQGLIPGWVITETQKMVLDTSLLNTQHHKVWIKGMWSNLGKGVVLFPASEKGDFGSLLTIVSLLMF